jgi:hypothetical protein
MLFRNVGEVAERETLRFGTGMLGAVVYIAIWFVCFGSLAALEIQCLNNV